MIYDHAFAEYMLETAGELGRKSYFRHEKENLVAPAEHIVDKMDIDFGLAARCYTVEQRGLMIGQSAVDLSERARLGFGQNR